MKAKTQMTIGLIGLCSLIVLIVIRICQFVFNKDFVALLIPFIFANFFALYIFSIMKRKINIATICYRIWCTLTVIVICFSCVALVALVISGSSSEDAEAWANIIFVGLLFGFITLFLWMGFKGLKRIMEAEGELKNVKDITARKKLGGFFIPNQKIEEKRKELIEIVNLQNSGELIDWDGSKADTGQIERFKRLRQLALEVGASHISTQPQKKANEGELVVGIQAALQTATIINACKAATMAWMVALASAGASVLSAIAAWVAIVKN